MAPGAHRQHSDAAGGRAPARLHDVVEAAARRAPDAWAVADHTGGLTFEQLWHDAGELATRLEEYGGPGDRVSVVADNCLGWVVLSVGVSVAGRALAPLNQRATVADHVALVESVGAVVLAGQPAYLEPLRAALAAGRMPTVRAVVRLAPPGQVTGPLAVVALRRPTAAGPSDGAAPGAPDPVAAHPDLAWLLFSSGTTGEPKGVQLTHRGLLAAARATLTARPLGPDDVFLTCFSLCHVAAYNVVVTHLAARPVVLLERYRPDQFVEAVRRHGVTMASLAPTMLSSLLAHLDERPEDRAALSTLRAVAYGSSAIGPALLRRTLDELGVDLYQGYGMTEASGNVAFLGPADHRRAVGEAPQLLSSCGRPSAAVEVRITDEHGASRARGEAGEIVLRGPQVTPGYWRDPAGTAAAFVDGWYRTGDIGRFDADGYLSVVDRARDIVVSGGENISSRQVEEALLAVDGVRGAAVVGVPDEHWGEAVCACVELDPSASLGPEDIRRASRSLLAPFQVPKYVLVVAELPRNANGKVRKPELRTHAAETLSPGGRADR